MHLPSPVGTTRFRRSGFTTVYIACALLLLLYTQVDRVERLSHAPGSALQRVLAYKTPDVVRLRATLMPRKIWQSWKTDPLEFAERDSGRARSWPKLNPGHRYEVLTDGNDMHYVEEKFGPGPESVLDRPDIVETFRTLNATIIKADLLRYLVMYAEGGVYADIDVEGIRPVQEWIPPTFNETDVGLVISVEIDEPNFANHTILGPKSQSFCQWTFMAKPKHPVMLRLVDHTLHWLNEVAQKQETTISNIQLNFDEVITGTGPSAFTNAVLAEMTVQTHRRPFWDTFHALQEPILVGDILVLTVEAFAAGQGHSNSGNHDSPKALVRHHYHASLWPSRHPRYSHPGYGMVEECNWAPECVHNWTVNTAAWESLDYDDKVVQLAIKEQVDKDREAKEQKERDDHDREEKEKKAAELKEKCEAAHYHFIEPIVSPDSQEHPAEGDKKPAEPEKVEDKKDKPAEPEKKDEDKKDKPAEPEKKDEDKKDKPAEPEKKDEDKKDKPADEPNR